MSATKSLIEANKRPSYYSRLVSLKHLISFPDCSEIVFLFQRSFSIHSKVDSNACASEQGAVSLVVENATESHDCAKQASAGNSGSTI